MLLIKSESPQHVNDVALVEEKEDVILRVRFVIDAVDHVLALYEEN